MTCCLTSSSENNSFCFANDIKASPPSYVLLGLVVCIKYSYPVHNLSTPRNFKCFGNGFESDLLFNCWSIVSNQSTHEVQIVIVIVPFSLPFKAMLILCIELIQAKI